MIERLSIPIVPGAKRDWLLEDEGNCPGVRAICDEIVAGFKLPGARAADNVGCEPSQATFLLDADRFTVSDVPFLAGPP